MTTSHLTALRESGVWANRLELSERGTFFFYRETPEGLRWPIPESFAHSALIDAMLDSLPWGWRLTNGVKGWSVSSPDGAVYVVNPDKLLALFDALKAAGVVKG